MKKIVLFLFVLISLEAAAQIDSATLKAGKLTLRTDDWEAIGQTIANNSTYEGLYDSIKVKLRKGAYPNATALVTVDSVTNGELIALYLSLQSTTPAEETSVKRIRKAIKDINSPYVTRTLEAFDEIERAAFINRRSEGRKRLRKQ